MTSAPLVTIITVVRNDPQRLLSTFRSVSPYKTGEIEYVVVDGASTDDTVSVIRSHPELVDRFVSEPDRGIYDAMNKGIELAGGEYLLFLNAGDELLTDPVTIAREAPDDAIILHGRANMFDPQGALRYVKGKRLKSVSRFLKGMPMCHQAILYRRDAMSKYDLRFRVMADRVLTYNLVRKHGLKSVWYCGRLMVNYYEGGFSSSLDERSLREEEKLFYRSVGKSHYIGIKFINAQFKHKIKLPLKRLLGAERA